MAYDNLQTLVRSKSWTDLEKQWLSVIEEPSADPTQLLPVIDGVVKAGQEKLAETMGWAWLSTIKENKPAAHALQFARDLLVRLQDGEELREEILNLYVQAHQDHPQLTSWVDRSGLKAGKSVRRALRYLDVGLKLHPGAFLLHRTDDIAAELTEIDSEAEEAEIRTTQGKKRLAVSKLIDDYDVADPNDFHILEQLHPERIAELVEDDPVAMATGMVRCNQNRLDRDAMKLRLVPKYIKSESWNDWWGKIRTGVKKSANLRIEGRSPMFLIYDPVGQTVEEETQSAIAAATKPREWLDLVENYLRDVKHRGGSPDTAFLNHVQTLLMNRIDRFTSHGEPAQAFATALVIERLAADGVKVSGDVHGKALQMLKTAKQPGGLVAAIDDVRLWTLAVSCLEQALPDKWPEYFAELIAYAPSSQCDALARRVEEAGRAELLPPIVERVLDDPGKFTDAVMWIWKGPDVKASLPIPNAMELLTTILNLVGPKRTSEGKTSGQTVNEMRSRVRAGFSAKNYERFKKAIASLDLPLAQAVRRQITLADGLGPTVQNDLANILTAAYPNLYVKPKVEMWDDESVLYFTETGFATKKAELDELVNIKMRENAKAIGEAAARGDLSENSEYKFALEERDLLRARVAQINRELDIGKVLEPGDVPTDHVGIGHRVTLQPKTGGPIAYMTLLGVGDSDINKGTYAYKTPLAMQVLGKKLHERVSLALEGGKEKEYEITSFECAI